MTYTYEEIKAIYFSHLTHSEQRDPAILNRVDKKIAEDMDYQKKNYPMRTNEIAKVQFASAKRFSNKLK